MSVCTLGSKEAAGVYHTIINLLPPHHTYIEPFLGTGAVMRKKAPSFRNIGVDLDRWCVDGGRFPSVPGLELIQGDGLKFLKEFAFNGAGKTVLYCDPPYLPSPDGNPLRHKHDFSVWQHEELITVLRSLRCDIVLSGSCSELYSRRLSDWWSTSFQVHSNGCVRTEKIWCNYTPGAMHYHSYAGKDSTERQRIQRKAHRWASSYAKMEPGEQQAVLTAMLEAAVQSQQDRGMGTLGV